MADHLLTHHRLPEVGRLYINDRGALAGILFSAQDWNAIGVRAARIRLRRRRSRQTQKQTPSAGG